MLPALGSWLLLAVTNQLTQNVASIPFLWILPLATYLLTFILCFESDRWYRRSIFLPLAALALLVSGYGLHRQHRRGGALCGAALRGSAVRALHGAARRDGEPAPEPSHLTRFYLMMSAGGAVGGIGVGLVAPVLLTAYYELGIGLVLTAAVGMLRLAAALAGRWRRVARSQLPCAVFLGPQVREVSAGARHAERNFYGTLHTYDVDRGAPSDRRRVMLHGSIKHGEQYLDPSRRNEPTAYYGRSSGIGRSSMRCRRNRRGSAWSDSAPARSPRMRGAATPTGSTRSIQACSTSHAAISASSAKPRSTGRRSW